LESAAVLRTLREDPQDRGPASTIGECRQAGQKCVATARRPFCGRPQDMCAVEWNAVHCQLE